MKSIYGIKKSDLENYFISKNEKKFRATQVYEWLYKKRINSFDEMTNVSKETISLLKNNFSLKKLYIK